MKQEVLSSRENILILNLLEELEAMIRYASGAGMEVPPSVVALANQLVHRRDIESLRPFSAAEVRMLVSYHAVMSRRVAPSRPASLVFLQKTRHERGLLSLLGPVPLVQFLLIASLFFLFSIVGLALSPDVNTYSMNHGVFESSGVVLFLNLGFLLSCAGLGASFAALYDLNQKISEGTYDPRFDSIYLVDLIMGLISGLIIAELLPLNSQNGTESVIMDKPLFALLGGFSADVIYHILRRLVLQIRNMFGRDEKTEQQEAKQSSAK